MDPHDAFTSMPTGKTAANANASTERRLGPSFSSTDSQSFVALNSPLRPALNVNSHQDRKQGGVQAGPQVVPSSAATHRQTVLGPTSSATPLSSRVPGGAVLGPRGKKQCPTCSEITASARAKCPSCDHVFRVLKNEKNPFKTGKPGKKKCLKCSAELPSACRTCKYCKHVFRVTPVKKKQSRITDTVVSVAAVADAAALVQSEGQVTRPELIPSAALALPSAVQHVQFRLAANVTGASSTAAGETMTLVHSMGHSSSPHASGTQKHEIVDPANVKKQMLTPANDTAASTTPPPSQGQTARREARPTVAVPVLSDARQISPPIKSNSQLEPRAVGTAASETVVAHAGTGGHSEGQTTSLLSAGVQKHQSSEAMDTVNQLSPRASNTRACRTAARTGGQTMGPKTTSSGLVPASQPSNASMRRMKRHGLSTRDTAILLTCCTILLYIFRK